MENQQAQEIANLVRKKKYEKAYLVGKTVLKSDPNNKEVLESLYSLTAKLRSESMDFASKKANYSAISSFEILLQKVNELTGQDMYGNFN
ncbi:hypothetical protein [Kangiella marina]|uniref:Tetratricopeptide repeat protein n=1 Tax=Kangiella marina TaxID=1079178 RepID=A0ABP8IJC7_9GAMM